METQTVDRPADAKARAAALIAKLGWRPADERPILESFRKANRDWRRDRILRVQMHAQRVQDHLRRFTRARVEPVLSPSSRKSMGRPRAVWCIELRRKFRTLSDAAAFVGRKPSNVSQAIRNGVRCGPYHWEEYDAGKHATINELSESLQPH